MAKYEWVAWDKETQNIYAITINDHTYTHITGTSRPMAAARGADVQKKCSDVDDDDDEWMAANRYTFIKFKHINSITHVRRIYFSVCECVFVRGCSTTSFTHSQLKYLFRGLHLRCICGGHLGNRRYSSAIVVIAVMVRAHGWIYLLLLYGHVFILTSTLAFWW